MKEASAQVSKIIGAKPAAVWKALTTPKILKTFFFGSEITSAFQVGSPISFAGSFNGKAYEDKGEIQIADRERRLAFSHWSPLAGEADTPANYHVVTFDLAPEGEGTKVTLTQSNLLGGVKESDRKNRAEYEKNWAMLLDGLDRAVSGRGAAKAADKAAS